MSNFVDLRAFGEYVRVKREALDYTYRSLADLVGIKPTYMFDIEKGNRAVSEKYLESLREALRVSTQEAGEPGGFYDLAGRCKNDHYSDLAGYLGQKDLARVALRRARDLGISDSQWENIINSMESPDNENEKR